MDGNKLKQLRKEMGMTQSELGNKLGVVKQTVSSWENNISEPNGDMLIKLSVLFNVSPEYLLNMPTNGNSLNINQKDLSFDQKRLLLYYKKYPSEVMELLHSFCSLDKKKRTIILGKCFELEREQQNNVALKEAE